MYVTLCLTLNTAIPARLQAYLAYLTPFTKPFQMKIKVSKYLYAKYVKAKGAAYIPSEIHKACNLNFNSIPSSHSPLHNAHRPIGQVQ